MCRKWKPLQYSMPWCGAPTPLAQPRLAYWLADNKWKVSSRLISRLLFQMSMCKLTQSLSVHKVQTRGLKSWLQKWWVEGWCWRNLLWHLVNTFGNGFVFDHWMYAEEKKVWLLINEVNCYTESTFYFCLGVPSLATILRSGQLTIFEELAFFVDLLHFCPRQPLLLVFCSLHEVLFWRALSWLLILPLCFQYFHRPVHVRACAAIKQECRERQRKDVTEPEAV